MTYIIVVEIDTATVLYIMQRCMVIIDGVLVV